jgi:hypothetical protein
VGLQDRCLSFSVRDPSFQEANETYPWDRQNHSDDGTASSRLLLGVAFASHVSQSPDVQGDRWRLKSPNGEATHCLAACTGIKDITGWEFDIVVL